MEEGEIANQRLLLKALRMELTSQKELVFNPLHYKHKNKVTQPLS